jgi:DNA-directed RNA polymerase subunit RPC12/RpoP
MTGEPEFTFRDSNEHPECRKCGALMEHEETIDSKMEETDVYICPECGTKLEDKWSY